jgi:hypothetical protein
MSTTLRFLNSKDILLAAVVALLLAEGLDIISTLLVMAFVPGAGEGNPLMRDPNTFKFLLGQGLKVKGLYLGVKLLPFCGLLYWGSRSPGVASVPIWLDAWEGLHVVFSNFTQFLKP